MLSKFRKALTAAYRCIKSNSGNIAYYAMVALVLSAIAWAAQGFRAEDIPAARQTVAVSMDKTENIPKTEAVFAVLDPKMILRSYSSIPEWDNWMKCWHTHAAVDYACEDGIVKSLSDGMVESVGEDSIAGGYVEISTGTYLLKYASIETDSSLEPGMKIKMGDTIGTAGTGMVSEAHLGKHVHLEVRKDGKLLDYFDLKDEMCPA